VIALNAVIGLAYYVRAAGALFGRPDPERAWPRIAWPVGLALAAVTLAGAVFGLAPQLVLAR
jgi:NADH-quinone oxidoreductase subunit N